MVEVFAHVMLTMAAGSLVAAAGAWLSWLLLSWTRLPALGPVILFLILVFTLHASDFTQMLLLFSGLFALAALVTLAGERGNTVPLIPSHARTARQRKQRRAGNRPPARPNLPDPAVRTRAPSMANTTTLRRNRGPRPGRAPRGGTLIR